jgi:hypothetical protein
MNHSNIFLIKLVIAKFKIIVQRVLTSTNDITTSVQDHNHALVLPMINITKRSRKSNILIYLYVLFLLETINNNDTLVWIMLKNWHLLTRSICDVWSLILHLRY